MTTQQIDYGGELDVITRERRNLLTVGTEVTEVQLIMRRLVDIFKIPAKVVGVEEHPEYLEAKRRLLSAEAAIDEHVIGGLYIEQ